MTEPILQTSYWKSRLEKAPGDAFHHAIYRCPLETWLKIEHRHRALLKEVIQPHDAILDAGCAWGRLLTLLPATWRGAYLGVDLSPDFIDLARQQHPERLFEVMDLRTMPTVHGIYDWAIMISIKPMIQRNCGDDVWLEAEKELKRVCKKLLFLEYDENDRGVVA